MPGAGTLESLNIEVGASSQKASSNIDKLVNSLRSLNSELQSLARMGKIKLPSIITEGSKTGSNVKVNNTAKAIADNAKNFKATASVLKEFKGVNPNTWQSWRYGPRPLPNIKNGLGTNGMLSEEDNKRLNPQWYKNNAQQSLNNIGNKMNGVTTAAGAATGAVNNMGNQVKTTAKAVVTSSNNMQTGMKYVASTTQSAGNTIATSMKNGATNTKTLSNNVKEAGEEAKKTKGHFGKLSETMSQIGRIFKTMMIRTALKSLIKGFSQSWQAAYAFSEKMNGTFAKSVDATRTIIADTTTSIIQTFAPVFEKLTPVLYVVSNAIQYLCNAIQKLFELIGLTSDIMGAGTSSINKYYGASDKAGKSNKNLLASWDQLNMIQSANNSANGNGYKPGTLKDLISTEADAIMSIITGEVFMAIGLILIVTGHIGAGAALLAVGAASIAKVLVADWSKIPKQIKKTIATIMGIVGTASLAIGLILAFTGHIGIGAGLMAIGVANLVSITAAAWGEDAESGVKQTLTTIMSIAGGALLAIGLILTLTGVATPLGIGMMVAGGASLAGATALNWDSLVQTIRSVLNQIASLFNGIWNTISSAVSNAWNAVVAWTDENIVDNVKTAWNAVSAFFSTLFGDRNTQGSIAYYANIAWNSVSKWWDANIDKPIEYGWKVFTDFFKVLFGDASTTGSIAYYASVAWTLVSEWWTTNISEPLNQIWGNFKSFFEVLFGDSTVSGSIANCAVTAFNSVAKWWTFDVMGEIGKVWNGLTGFFKNIFVGENGDGGILGSFNSLWNTISNLWGDITGALEIAWGSVKTWFDTNVIQPIKDSFKSAINFIIDLFNEHLIGNLNAIGNFSIPGVSIYIGWPIYETLTLWDDLPVSLWNIPNIPKFADGMYDIPEGDLFIANEAGAELVGSMNGKTTVANQGQIIEGIKEGVYAAQSEQNSLLKRQNELLLGILQKSDSIEVHPSADWGKFNRKSSEMWAMATGR